VGPSPAGSLTGPIEKIPRCGERPIWPHTAKRWTESYCGKHPLSNSNLSQPVGVDLSSSRACDASPTDRELEHSSALPETSEGQGRLVRLSYHVADETT
jgi:hypothetical protein